MAAPPTPKEGLLFVRPLFNDLTTVESAHPKGVAVWTMDAIMSEGPKPIVFTRHALDRCAARGATEADVTAAIRNGQREPAQRGL